MKSNITELCEFVERITNVANAKDFLLMLVDKQKGSNGGGLSGITFEQYQKVCHAGGAYSYEIGDSFHYFNIRQACKYESLPNDNLASLVYAIAYVELMQGSIPYTDEGQALLINHLFS